jgi:hypothetical protein
MTLGNVHFMFDNVFPIWVFYRIQTGAKMKCAIKPVRNNINVYINTWVGNKIKFVMFITSKSESMIHFVYIN